MNRFALVPFVDSGRRLLPSLCSVERLSHDRIRDTMERALAGFEDFNARARHPHVFRISRSRRESGSSTLALSLADFSLARLRTTSIRAADSLMPATMGSHNQFNTTIYSNDDRYRGLKCMRTVIFMNKDDMRERGIDEFGLIDVKSFSKDGTERSVHGYWAVRYELRQAALRANRIG